MQTYYEILGVENTAASSDIKRAYRSLAKQYHPDVNPNKANAAAQFVKIQQAYEILIDDTRRHQYDSELSGMFFHMAQQPFEHYFVATTTKSAVKLNDELHVTFTYSGEGRMFRKPDFDGFLVLGRPVVKHAMVCKGGIDMKETSLTYTIAPLRKGVQKINSATIKIFDKHFSTAAFGLYVEDNACFFSNSRTADGMPYIVPLQFDQYTRGHFFTASIQHPHDVLVPRSKVATNFHHLGKVVKILTAAWATIYGIHHGLSIVPAIICGMVLGGINCHVMYLLAGIKSRFRYATHFPLVQHYFANGYYPRMITGVDRHYNHVAYFAWSLIF